MMDVDTMSNRSRDADRSVRDWTSTGRGSTIFARFQLDPLMQTRLSLCVDNDHSLDFWI